MVQVLIAGGFGFTEAAHEIECLHRVAVSGATAARTVIILHQPGVQQLHALANR